MHYYLADDTIEMLENLPRRGPRFATVAGSLLLICTGTPGLHKAAVTCVRREVHHVRFTSKKNPCKFELPSCACSRRLYLPVQPLAMQELWLRSVPNILAAIAAEKESWQC